MLILDCLFVVSLLVTSNSTEYNVEQLQREDLRHAIFRWIGENLGKLIVRKIGYLFIWKFILFDLNFLLWTTESQRERLSKERCTSGEQLSFVTKQRFLRDKGNDWLCWSVTSIKTRFLCMDVNHDTILSIIRNHCVLSG